MSYPIHTSQSKINIRTSDMTTEKLYYCICSGTLFLFYKDKDLLLNCFEVTETDLINKIKNINNKNKIDKILEKYAQTNLNIK